MNDPEGISANLMKWAAPLPLVVWLRHRDLIGLSDCLIQVTQFLRQANSKAFFLPEEGTWRLSLAVFHT